MNLANYYKEKIIYAYGALLQSKNKNDISYLDLEIIFRYFVCIKMNELDDNNYKLHKNKYITNELKTITVNPFYLNGIIHFSHCKKTKGYNIIAINENAKCININGQCEIKIYLENDFIQYCKELVEQYIKLINKTVPKSSLLIDDIFMLICNEMTSLSDIVKLGLMSKKHNYIIRTNTWDNHALTINNNMEANFILYNYNFRNLIIKPKVHHVNRFGNRLRNVRKLYLDTYANNNTMKYLDKCNDLTIIGTSVTDYGIRKLVKCNKIRLIDCQLLEGSFLHYFNDYHTIELTEHESFFDWRLEQFKNCHTVNIKGCYNVTDVGIVLLKHCHTLNLSECRKITDKGIMKLGNCHDLNISGTDVTDKGVKYLGKCHTLNASHTDITDRGVRYLGDCFNLNVSHTYVSDYGVMYLENCHILNIESTYITDTCTKYLKKCYILNISVNQYITDKGMKNLIDCHTLDLLGTAVTHKGVALLKKCNIIDIGITDALQKLARTQHNINLI